MCIIQDFNIKIGWIAEQKKDMYKKDRSFLDELLPVKQLFASVFSENYMITKFI